MLTLQTLPACASEDQFGDMVGKVAGFSLHAGVAAKAHERKKLERLCRYIAPPAVSEKRLSLTRGDNVRYELKTSYRDGTTHVVFELLDFIARLAALVPKPRVNLTRFHGVFAPNSKHRAVVTKAARSKVNKARVSDEPPTPTERRASMTWAQRLKRVFNIDIETCRECGGAMKVIACIEDPVGDPESPESPEGKGCMPGCVSVALESRPATNALVWLRKTRSRGTQGYYRRRQARVVLGRRFRLGGSRGRNPVDFAG